MRKRPPVERNKSIGTFRGLLRIVLMLCLLIRRLAVPSAAFTISPPPCFRHRRFHPGRLKFFSVGANGDGNFANCATWQTKDRNTNFMRHRHFGRHYWTRPFLWTPSMHTDNIFSTIIDTRRCMVTSSGDGESCTPTSDSKLASDIISNTTDTENDDDNMVALSPLAKAIEESIHHVIMDEKFNSAPLEMEVQSINNNNNYYYYNNIQNRTSVIITLSVSGGCDSMAMLHACMEWWNRKTFHNSNVIFQVVHFNHQQREESSYADAALVQNVCLYYGIPCYIELWQEDYQSSSLSFSQDIARQWRRRRLFERTKQALMTASYSYSQRIGIILTAHHFDDSMESLMLKAIRGVHLLNLSGMVPRTNLESAEAPLSSIYLVRPWVQHITKQQILDYLQNCNYTWREDESNDSPKYLRNRIRNELVPLLQDLSHGTFVPSRIPAWIQQSQALQEDLQPRIQQHLTQVVLASSNTTTAITSNESIFDWKASCALLHDDEFGHPSLIHTSLVQSQAIYQWIMTTISSMTTTTTTTTSNSMIVSQETLERVLNQLCKYPNNTEWSLELGKGWTLHRNGHILQISSPLSHVEDSNPGSIHYWTWSIMKNDETIDQRKEELPYRWCMTSQENERRLLLWLPANYIVQEDDASSYNKTRNVSFYQMSLKEYEHRRREKMSWYHSQDEASAAVRFVPPWKSSSIKLRQFLRGQKVPVHCRNDVQVLLLETIISNNDGSDLSVEVIVVAVQIVQQDGQEEWILHGDYCPRKNMPYTHGSNNENNNNDEKILVELIPFT